ncbi:MAG: hypothetical protein KDD48_00445 [Bdellovibrionales bacterium]|nr:hypothetical protein [Bdellovibrionales bacterium]
MHRFIFVPIFLLSGNLSCSAKAPSDSLRLTSPDCPGIWKKSDLFDATSKSFFIPYEIWTGEPWNKIKEIPKGKIDKVIKSYGKQGSRISGPFHWTHPILKKTFHVYKRERLNSAKEQLFVFNKQGIGRVLDRRPKRKDRYYDGLNIKFPAGFGWKIGVAKRIDFYQWIGTEKRQRSHEVIVANLKFDRCDKLVRLVSHFLINGRLDHVYNFEPNKGMVDAFQQ